jgi:hypothetical protein
MYALLALIILHANALQSIGPTNPGLDPSPLRGWLTKWRSNPIELSITNSGTTASLTFLVNPSTSIDSGVLEVIFPNEFGVSAATCSTTQGCIAIIHGQVVSVPSVTLKAGVDNSVSISGVVLPETPGGYGPFALRTRHFVGGQTVDINLNFGSVGVSKKSSPLYGLSVDLPRSSRRVGGVNSTLQFKFKISTSLRQYDIFKVTVSQYWTVGPGASCYSAGLFNGTRPADPHFLDCYVIPKTPNTPQVVYIYGLANDVPAEFSQQVVLRISSVTNPDAAYSQANYMWTVATLRGSTRTVLEQSTISGGPWIEPGVIESSQYASTWGMPTANIVQGLVMFMDFAFTTMNPIKEGGSAELVFTDDISAGYYPNHDSEKCWLHNYLTYVAHSSTLTASCEVASSANAYISNLPAVTLRTTLKATFIVTFSNSASASSSVLVKTLQPSGDIVDATESLGLFTRAKTSKAFLADSFNIKFGTDMVPSNGSDNAKAGTDSNQVLMFEMYPRSGILTSGTYLTLKFPFKLSTDIQDFSIAIPKTNVIYFLDSMSDGLEEVTQRYQTSDVVIEQASTQLAYSGQHLGTMKLQVDADSQVGDLTYFAMKSNGRQIVLPRYASNAATRYEAYLEVYNPTDSTRHQLRALQFQIYGQNFKNPIRSLCSETALLIIKFNFSPSVTNVPLAASGTTFYLELDFTDESSTDLGSGLPDGSEYPFGVEDYPLTSLKLTTGLSPLLTGTLTTGISTDNDPVLYTVIAYTGLSFEPKASTFYRMNNDPRLKFTSHLLDVGLEPEPEPEPGGMRRLIVLPNDPIQAQALNSASSLGLASELDTLAEGGLLVQVDMLQNYSAFWSFSFPLGWTVAQGATVTNSALTTIQGIVISPDVSSSTRHLFKMSTLLLDDASNFIGFSDVLTFNGIATSAYKLPDDKVVFTFIGSIEWDSYCQFMSAVTNPPYTMSAGTLDVSVSPSTVVARGPGSLSESLKVTFKSSSVIYERSQILAVIDSRWGMASAACVVDGLTKASYGASVLAVISGQTCKVTQFADVQANTPIALSLINLTPPVSPGSIPLLTSLTTVMPIGLVDYEVSVASNIPPVNVSAANSTGRSTILEIKTFPQVTWTLDVDLYLKFSLEHPIPKGGVLEVVSPLTYKLPSSPKDQVWLSPLEYSEVYFRNNILGITLAQPYEASSILELYLDRGVDNPLTTSVTSTGFVLRSSYEGATIDSDILKPLISSQLFAVASPPWNLLSSTIESPVFSPSQACESASYSFNFTSSAKFESTDQVWVVFPDQFDPYLGSAQEWYSTEPATYYIRCSCPQIPEAYCKVDHHVLILTGNTEVQASTWLTVTVEGVMNPPADYTDDFQILHVDSKGTIKSLKSDFMAVKPTPPAPYLEFTSIAPSNRTLFETGSYVFEFSLSPVLSSSVVQIVYPQEFSLKVNSTVAYPCKVTCLDDTQALYSWSDVEVCNVTNNTVTLPALTAITSGSLRVSVTLQGINNPEYGQFRVAAEDWDFEASDADVWPMYDVWTNNFQVLVVDPTTKGYAYRSYGVLSKSYLGFKYVYKRLAANNDTGLKVNPIVVYPGSETVDLTLSTVGSPCSAKQILFKPRTDAYGLEYRSKDHNFTLLEGQQSIGFRVAAAADISKGLYYIDWTIEETTGQTYSRPVRTLVEVAAKTPHKYKFQVPALSSVPRGSTSLLFSVTVSNAPANNVTITITSATPGISVAPSVLVFSPGVNDASFQISVSSSVAVSSDEVWFSLSGGDADVYSIDSSAIFAITS